MFFIPIPLFFNIKKEKNNSDKNARVEIFKTLQNSGYVDDMTIRHSKMMIEAARIPIPDKDISDEEWEKIVKEHKQKSDLIMTQIKSEHKNVYGF